MNFSDFIYKYFPVSVFKFIRKQYYTINRRIYPPMDKDEFWRLLTEKLGIEKGMVVYIHSSVDKLNVNFSAFELLELLIKAVGKEGTLLFPCWHYKGRAEDFLSQTGAVFNVKKSPTVMGLLPELARRHKNAFRSLHPTASTVALGKLAEEFTKEHHFDLYPNGEKSPLYKIIHHNGKIIGLGEKTVSLSFVHVVEDIMKEKFPVKTLSDKPVTCKVVNYSGKEQEISTYIPHKNISNRDIPGFIKKNISKNAVRCIKYKGSNFFSITPRVLFDEMLSLAEKGITIYGTSK